MTEKPKAFVTKIQGCSRCGGEHADLEFRQLQQAIQLGELGPTWDFWAACPTNGEPILCQWDTENRPDLPRSQQILEGPDLFLHLARANRDLGATVVELLVEQQQLREQAAGLQAELAKWPVVTDADTGEIPQDLGVDPRFIEDDGEIEP